MRITDLSRTKRGRYAVSVEGQYLFSLHEEVFYTARLAVGMDLSVEELEALRRESDYKTAKERALRLLSARGYTAHQLKEKLPASCLAARIAPSSSSGERTFRMPRPPPPALALTITG